MEFALDAKNKHGGRREGAGRPAIGETRKVSITLPSDVWKKIDSMKGDFSYSAFFRAIILSSDYDWRD
ncbi:CopG family transcriptional regulator [Bacillus smithii]|uniref:CopG family transcriptional regulator n=1 Tax=Bacillus smithii TaxID=1479 RepID=UPI003D21415D